MRRDRLAEQRIIPGLCFIPHGMSVILSSEGHDAWFTFLNVVSARRPIAPAASMASDHVRTLRRLMRDLEESNMTNNLPFPRLALIG